MRVLLQGRSARSVATAAGGDQFQLDQTARFLRSHYDVDAHTSSELEPDLSSFDAVHLFGIVRPQEVWLQARNARRQGLPVFLSTVYCDFAEFEQRDRRGSVGWLARHTTVDQMEALKAGGRAIVSREWNKGTPQLFFRGYRRMQRQIIDMTTAFLPNSWSEWRRMQRDLGLSGLSDDRVTVVPNGVDLTEMNRSLITAEDLAPLSQFEGCVLCVARMEGRKNQIRLLEALAETGLQVVLAGPPTPNQKRYVAEVRAVARRHGAHVLGEVSLRAKRALYALARVHALPSWMETTGLSSLEAAVMGCSLVLSPNGDTHEYFGDFANYCDPNDPESIRDAVLAASRCKPSEELANRVATEFTWERAAQATLKAYAAHLE